MGIIEAQGGARMKRSNTSERLKYLMEAKNLKQSDIIERVTAMGEYISKSALSQYVNGQSTPDQRKLTILSKALDVSEVWLMGYGDTELKNIKNILFFKPSTKKIPVIGTIAAGEPILAVENIEEYIDLDKKISADFALRVRGDSMVGANIFDGDIVFIRKQSDVDDGEIAAVIIDDSATLKRVFKFENKVVLRAENPKYKPILLDGDKSVYIVGKAVYKLSEIY